VDVELDFEKRYRLAREIVETIVLTVLMFLIIRLAVQNFNIDGHSMEPNLHDQELILVDKWSYIFHTPSRGDVIVFQAPPNPTQDYIKRIVGLPGDVITVQDNTVFVNGKRLQEKYIDEHYQGNPYQPIVNSIVPPNSYFVMGDNRGGSSDSREWGCVPKESVVGRAALIYWPFGQDNSGLLPNYAHVFQDVPSPQKEMAQMTCQVRNAPIEGTTSSDSTVFTMDMLLGLALPLIIAGYKRRCVSRNQ